MVIAHLCFNTWGGRGEKRRKGREREKEFIIIKYDFIYCLVLITPKWINFLPWHQVIVLNNKNPKDKKVKDVGNCLVGTYNNLKKSLKVS